MAGEDLEPNAPLPADAAPGQAVDMSKQSNLSKAWNAWTSRPENNAALINFGLNLMQPKYPGESGLGHFASAIGSGAEASQRNIETQRKQEAEETEQAQKERALDIKEKEVGAYARGVDQRAGGGTQAKLAQQLAMKKWVDYNTSPEDVTGIPDVTTSRLRKLNPTKWGKYTKTDVLNDPEAKAAARKMILGDTLEDAKTFGLGGEGGGGDTVVQNGFTYRRQPDGSYI